MHCNRQGTCMNKCQQLLGKKLLKLADNRGRSRFSDMMILLAGNMTTGTKIDIHNNLLCNILI